MSIGDSLWYLYEATLLWVSSHRKRGLAIAATLAKCGLVGFAHL